MSIQSETLNHNKALSNFLRLDVFVEKNRDLFTKTQFKWLIRNRQVNGLTDSRALMKISGKLYVNQQKMADWIASQIT